MYNEFAECRSAYTGPERRRADRSKLLTNGPESEEMANGIKHRVNGILNGSTADGTFSSSAADALAAEYGNIAIRKGVLTVHNGANDKFGSALVHRDDDGEFTRLDVPPGGKIIVSKGPIVSIATTPADPKDVQSKADAGELRFEFTPAKTMAAAEFRDGKWSACAYVPTGSIEFGPTADRYGQAIFGGNRALRLEDGTFALFRPDMHARRFLNNAGRIGMPMMSEAELVEVYKELTRANADYMPATGKGSLYIAPGLRASRDQLGVKPNIRYVFSCLAVPAGKIFDKPAALWAERDFHRVPKGGIGDVKAAGHYAPTFAPKAKAKADGFDDIIYSDNTNAEARELSSSNIFFVTPDGILVTPNLSGEILNGITRDSILQIAKELVEAGVISAVEERPIRLEEYGNMKEAFSCGTGVTINAVQSVTDGDREYQMDISHNNMGRVTRAISDKFNAILSGNERNNPRYKDWFVVVE